MMKTGLCLLIQLFLQRSGAVPEPDTHIHVYVPPGSGWQLLIKEEKLQSSTCPREAYICANTQCVLCSVRCPCIIYGPLVTTIWRRAGCRGIFGEAGMDTGAYLGGNHGFRVWKSQKCEKMHSAHSSKLGQIYTLWDTKTHILWFKHSDSIIQLVLSPKGAPPNEEGLTNQGPVQRPEAEIPPFKGNFQGAG